MSAPGRPRDERSRSTDVERGIKAALKNGFGTLVSRSIIILGLPVLTITTGLGGYAVKLTLDGIAKDIQAVAKDTGDVKAALGALGETARQARADITQLQIGAATLRERTAGIESKVDDLRQARR